MFFSKPVLITTAVIALCSCNFHDADRTTSVPPRVGSVEVTPPIVTASAPLAAPDRSPVPPNANAAAPGTNASLAFASTANEVAQKLPGPKGGLAQAQEMNVAAQKAAAQAPDTASADAAKRELQGDSAGGKTARDTAANAPRGSLSKEQEVNEMPRANQANNHSSTALDKPAEKSGQ